MVAVEKGAVKVVTTCGEYVGYDAGVPGVAVVVGGDAVTVVDGDKQTLWWQLLYFQQLVTLYTTQPLLSLRYLQLELAMVRSPLVVAVEVPVFVAAAVVG